MAAILEFYLLFRFWPMWSHPHVILRQPAKFCLRPNFENRKSHFQLSNLQCCHFDIVILRPIPVLFSRIVQNYAPYRNIAWDSQYVARFLGEVPPKTRNSTKFTVFYAPVYEICKGWANVVGWITWRVYYKSDIAWSPHVRKFVRQGAHHRGLYENLTLLGGQV